MTKKNKFSLVIFLLLLLCYLSLKFLVPFIAKPKVEKVLQGHLNKEVRIEKISLGPLFLDLEVDNISIQKELTLGRAYLNLSLEGLLNKTIVIQNLNLERLDVEFIKNNDRYQVKGLEEIETAQKEEKESSVENSWKLKFNQIDLKNFIVSYQNEKRASLDFLKIENLLSYDSEVKTSLSGEFSINDSKLKLNGYLNHYFSKPQGTINLNVSNFNLSNLNDFTPQDIGRLEGEISLESKVSLKKEFKQVDFSFHTQELKNFSKDLKTIKYFVKDLKTKNAKLVIEKDLSLTIDEMETMGLVLSTPAAKFEKERSFSEFSRFSLNDVDFEMNQSPEFVEDEVLMKLSALYNNEAPIKAKRIYKNNKENLVVKIDSLDLSPLSEAFQESLGYHIESGKLNLDLTTQTKDKEVDGEVTVRLDQLQLDDEDQQGKEIESKSSFSLPTAIKIIKDDQGSVEVSLDISGNEDNPNFGFLSLLQKGLGSIILSKFTVMVGTKVATKLVPMLVASIPFSPGNAFMLIQGGYKFATKPRFKDIKFEPLSTDIKDESLEQIEKLSSFLKKNSDFFFNICPQATRFEGENESASPSISKERAFELAHERIKKMKEVFSKYKLPLGQVVFCRPKLSEEKLVLGTATISL